MNCTPKVLCLTFGVQFKIAEGQKYLMGGDLRFHM